MSEKCPSCGGSGYSEKKTEKCTKCNGDSKQDSKPIKFNFNEMRESDISFLVGGKCPECKGSGFVETVVECKECRGSGNLYYCEVCNRKIPYLNKGNREICNACLEKTDTIVYKLDNVCGYEDLELGKIYIGVVESVREGLGAFVKLNDNITGLMHVKNITKLPERGDVETVLLKDMKKRGSDTKLDLIQKHIKKHEVIEIEKEIPPTVISDLSDADSGKLICIQGEVLQVKQTGGPTIFLIADQTGQVPCAGFTTAGQRSYEEIDSGMVVSAIGVVNLRDDAIQIELASMKQMNEDDSNKLLKLIEEAIDKKSEPHDIPFLVESETLEKLRPAMLKAAKEIRKAILRSRPIILRHHADADGITSGIAIEKAILPLINKVNDSDTSHYYKRSPSKAPFYELTDVIKDVSYAVEDNIRFGDQFPLIIMVDNGSTEEDAPAYEHARIYGMDIVVIDHHHPDDMIDDYLLAHVNPYKVGGDFGLTAGMLCTEVARLINPDVSDEIIHLPAVAGVGDRSDSTEFEQYKNLVSDKYSVKNLGDIALALDFEQYWLRFGSGVGIIDDILNMRDEKIHKNLVSMLCSQANSMILEQLNVTLPNVKTETLKSGAILNFIDVEKYAHKFTFPAPGKTSGEIHDIMCTEKFPGKPVITLGVGPDFIVIRSKDVNMNIPQMVQELKSKYPGAGVSGGGHLIVGSIKFVEGARDLVVEKLIEYLEQTPVNV
ncbi:MAG: DHH family phosphoesterase [Methanosarcinaceae archaeon]|nr:DHH family phosphoesterase [Methanosarcinaceae archaeon]